MSSELRLLVERLVRTQVFLEGVMDAETTQISRMIVDSIKKEFFSGASQKPRKKTWKYKLPMNGFPKPVLIVLIISPMSNLEQIKTLHGEFQVARYSQQPPASGIQLPELPPDQLTLNVGVPKDESKLNPSQLEPFVLELKSVIRHELEHAQQKKRGFQTSPGIKTDPWSQNIDTSKVFTDPVTALQYYASPDEVEAYVMQIYRSAKMKKIPFEQAMKQYITGVMGQSIIKGMGVGQGIGTLNKIKKAWMDYAKKRLPQLF